MPIQKNALLIWPYFLMIMAGLMVPSDGNHGVLSIKSLTFITATVFLGLYALLKQKISLSQLRLLCFLIFSLAFLTFWLLISMARDQTTPTAQLDQFKLFLITIIFPLSTFYMVQDKLLTSQQILKAVIYASLFYVLLKVSLVLLHLLHIVDVWEVLEKLGIRFMRMNIYGGLERVQTSVDIVTPFLVFFVLQAERLGVKLKTPFKWAYLILSLFSTFLSFSRYLVFVYILSCALYWITLGPRALIKSLLVMFCLCFASYLAIGPETIHKIIERRVFSRDNFKSDEARVSQIKALYGEHEQVPYVGKGMGGYAERSIRDRILLHSYEVQWIAFLMQFGWIGILVMMIPLSMILLRYAIKPFSRVRWSFVGLFLLWLLSGFTNPFLISLTSGIVYSLFFLSADMLEEPLKTVTA